MCKDRGWIVQALAGREKNEFFCVVDVEAETGYLLLADGKRRKVACPKRKKKKHPGSHASRSASQGHLPI